MLELDKLKQLLGISTDDTNKDVYLEFVLDDVFQIIKDYCHIKEVPEELNNTVIKMAIDLYRYENLGNEEGPLGSISAISQGDVTMQFTSNKYNTAIGAGGADFLKNYKLQLNKYRKLVW